MTPTFKWFLVGYGLDRWADMLWTTILAWLATSAPNPTIQGLVLAAAFVPHVGALLFGGVRADRNGSDAVSRVTTLAKAILLGGLLIIHAGIATSLVVLALFAALLAVVDGFHDPAMDSWGMHLRPPEEQQAAAAAESAVWRIGQSVGAATGGLLLGVNTAAALGAGVVLVLLARACLAVVSRQQDSKPGKPEIARSSASQIRAGTQFLAHHAILPTVMGIQITCTLITSALLMLVFPSLVRDHGWPTIVYGGTATLFGLGLVCGSVLVMRDQNSRANGPRIRKPVVAALWFAAACHLPVVAIAVAANPFVLLVGSFLYGTLLAPVGALLSGYRRAQTPTSMSGVVTAAAKLLLIAPEPLGPLAAGLIATAVGSGTTVWICSIAGVVLPLAALSAVHIRTRSQLPSDVQA